MWSSPLKIQSLPTNPPHTTATFSVPSTAPFSTIVVFHLRGSHLFAAKIKTCNVVVVTLMTSAQDSRPFVLQQGNRTFITLILIQEFPTTVIWKYPAIIDAWFITQRHVTRGKKVNAERLSSWKWNTKLKQDPVDAHSWYKMRQWWRMPRNGGEDSDAECSGWGNNGNR